VTWDSNDNWTLPKVGELKDLYSEAIAADYAGNFDNLEFQNGNWSSTERAGLPHASVFYKGIDYWDHKENSYSGLAVFSGQVSAIDPVPEPAAMLLFGLGLLGVAGINRRKTA